MTKVLMVRRPLSCLLAFIFLLFGLDKQAFSQRYPKKIQGMIDKALELIDTDQDSSIFFLEKAEVLARITEDTWVLAVTAGNTGVTNSRLGRFEIAYLDFTSAVNLFNQSDTLDFANLALCYDHMGFIHESFGDHTEALKLYQEAQQFVELFKSQFPERIDARNDLTMIQYDLGVCLMRLEEYDRAEAIFEDMYVNSEMKGKSEAICF